MSLSVSRRCAVNIEVPGDGERQHSRGGRQRSPSSAWRVAWSVRAARWSIAARIRVPLQALEVGANVRRVLVAQVAIFFEALVDDAFQFRRHVGIQAHWRHRSAVENRIENDRRAVPAKWPRARRHFVEHDAEREQIGARVQRLSRGPARATCTTPSRACCLDRSTAPRRNAWPASDDADGRRSGRCLREPEIENLRPARGEEDVRRLDVAMHDALAVRGIQGIGHGEGDVDEDRDVHRAASEPLLERLALEQLHRDERRIGADIVDGADIGVVER